MRYGCAVEGKRRLPLLPMAGDEAAGTPTRPAWQWVALGATAIFVVWVPLAASTASVAARWARHESGGGGPHGSAILFGALSSAALAVAAFAGGFVVGRSRGAASALREAALSGLTAALLAVIGSWITLGFTVGSLVVVAIAVAFSYSGGKVAQPGRRGNTDKR